MPESSAAVTERVVATREIQRKRFGARSRCRANAGMSYAMLKTHFKLDSEGQEMLRTAMEEPHLSARAYDRILKVSRTISDLAGADSIQAPHLLEAIQYRTLDRNLWH